MILNSHTKQSLINYQDLVKRNFSLNLTISIHTEAVSIETASFCLFKEFLGIHWGIQESPCYGSKMRRIGHFICGTWLVYASFVFWP